MKNWWILAYDYYYPGADNFHASFSSEEEAVDYLEDLFETGQDSYDSYEIINISDRL